MKPYYEANGITLYNADCYEVLPTISWPADLLVTDSPYAAAATTATSGFAKQAWGGNWGDMSLVKLMAKTVLDCLPNVTQSYWFCDPFSFACLWPLFFEKFSLAQSIVWDKDMLGIGAHYRKQTEFIIYARKQAAPALGSSERDLIRLRPAYAEKQHPNEKPLELMLMLLAASKYECVIDPFAGSGSTLIAAKQLGRKAVGIEIEERYCEIAARRLDQQLLGFTDNGAIQQATNAAQGQLLDGVV